MRGSTMLGVVTLLLAGCAAGGASGDEAPAAVADAYTGCPDVLVQADPPHHGFGTSAAASSAPALGEALDAWVCTYQAEDTGEPDPDGGALYEWRLSAGPATVEDDALDGVSALLDTVTVPPAERACTDDLGPRLLLVATTAERQLAMTIDEYGCREIRLTEDPWASAPGEPADPDLPAGVLVVDGPDPAATVRSLSGVGGER